MGSIASAFLQTATSENWVRLSRGPTLQRMFGAYADQDVWAVQRRFRQLDDGDGYISYEQLQQLICAEEFSLLFFFDLFATQNELLNVNQLLAVVCLFSAARLEQKGKFLLSIFDKSSLGICTAAEIAQMCSVVLSIFACCTGSANPKMKELSMALKTELIDLVPAYEEAVQLVGLEATFNEERIIHHSELSRMLIPITGSYERMQVAKPPPDGGCAPPPGLSWGIEAGAKAPGQGGSKPPVVVGPSRAKELATAIPDNSEPHLRWMSKLEESPQSQEDDDSGPKFVKRWLLTQATEFSAIAKDIHGFQRLFVKAMSAAVGLPSNCVEVVSVVNANGVGGTILVEFVVHPSDNKKDNRGISTFEAILEQQMRSSHSALRKGPLGVHIEGAKLLAVEPKRAASPVVQSTAHEQVTRCDMCVQTEADELVGAPWPVRRPVPPPRKNKEEKELDSQIRTALRALDAMRKRTIKADTAYAKVSEDLKRRQEELTQLHLQEKLHEERKAQSIIA